MLTIFLMNQRLIFPFFLLFRTLVAIRWDEEKEWSPISSWRVPPRHQTSRNDTITDDWALMNWIRCREMDQLLITTCSAAAHIRSFHEILHQSHGDSPQWPEWSHPVSFNFRTDEDYMHYCTYAFDGALWGLGFFFFLNYLDVKNHSVIW